MKATPLFNVNGVIGRGAYEEPDFPTAESLVAHMDYLGVDRSLVSHVEARDLSPVWGNQRLLEEIAESGSGDRLIPAFVVAPSCLYERGTLEFLKKSCASGRVRALRIHPETNRYPIILLERVLGELAKWKPVVFWECRHGGANDFRDIVHLAETLPNVSFILTGRGMFGFGSIIDAMWRRDNILADTSLMYVVEYLNVVIEEFGAERLVFGIGSKTHYGAAVAALAHAQISESDRVKIAHGNIERLLGLKPMTAKLARVPDFSKRKPLWETFRGGEAIKNINVIDAHGHIGPLGLGVYFRDVDLPTQAEKMTVNMKRLGIGRTIVSASHALFANSLEGNRLVESELGSPRGMFSGYVVFNPLYKDDLAPELDGLFKSGFFVGFKLLASYWKIPLTDPRYKPVWEYAERYCLPILMHTWDDAFNSPAMLEDIVRKYPHALFLLGHSGGGTRGRREAEELTLANTNVFLEFCGSFTTPLAYEATMKSVGPDRIVFGTDTWGHDPAWELGRYLSIPFPDKALAPGLGDNVLRLLNASMLKSTSKRRHM